MEGPPSSDGMRFLFFFFNLLDGSMDLFRLYSSPGIPSSSSLVSPDVFFSLFRIFIKPPDRSSSCCQTALCK